MAAEKTELVLGADISPLQRKLNEAKEDIKRFGTAGESAFGGMLGPLSALQSKFVAIGALLAGGAVFKEAIAETVKFTEESMKLGEALGISAGQASILREALEQGNTSQDEFVNAAKGLLKQVRENESGLNDMGLKTRDATGHLRPLNELTMDAIQVLNGYRAGTDRAIAGQVMFGKGFEMTSNLSRITNKDIAETQAQMESLGMVVSEESKAAWEEYNHATDAAHTTIKAIKTTIGNEFLPVLSEMANQFVDMGPSIVKQFSAIAKSVANAGRFLVEHGDAVITVGKAYLGLKITSIASSFVLGAQQMIASMLAHISTSNTMVSTNLRAAQSSVTHTGALAAHANMLLADARAAVANTAGMEKLSTVQNILIPAQLRAARAAETHAAAQAALATAATAASTAGRAAAGVLGLLGGPLGSIITLLGIAATAWVTFGSKAKANIDQASESVDELQKRLDNLAKEKKFGTGQLGKDQEEINRLTKEYADLLAKPLETAYDGGPAIAYREQEKRAILEKIALYSKLIIAQKAAANPPETPQGKSANGLLKNGPADGKNSAAKDPMDQSFLSTYEGRLAEIKNAYEQEDGLREFSKTQELAYWRELQQTYTLTSKDRLAVAKRTATLELEIRREEAKEMRALDALGVDAHRAAALGQLAADEQAAQFARENGQISKAQLIEIEEDFARRKFEIEYQSLLQRAELAKNDPTASPTALALLKEQMLQVERDYLLKKGELTQQKNKEGGMGGLFDDIGNSFGSGFNAILTKATTFRQQMANIFQGIYQSFVQNLIAKPVAEWIASNAKMLAIKLGFLTQEKGMDATATLASVSAKKLEAISIVQKNAAEGATGAAASQASIPIVGPELALAAMASTFAAISSFGMTMASASQGYDIPKGLNPLTQLHEEEMVLPQKYANVIRGFAASGQSSDSAPSDGGAVNVHINTMDVKGVRDWLKSNPDALAPAMRRAARNYSPRSTTSALGKVF